MDHIGIRDLRRYASRWIARVRAGESFVVTDRGRPVARLSPIEASAGYERLLAEGRIAPGTGRRLSQVLEGLDAELPPDDGPSVSMSLRNLRESER